MHSIRLFIVDDQPHALENKIKLLERYDNIFIVGTAQSAAEALKQIPKLSSHPHVVLCDINAPSPDTIRHLKALHRDIEILLSTVFEDEKKLLTAIEAGASGYLLKGTDITKVREAIIDVFHGGTVIQPVLTRKLLKYFSAPIKAELLEHEESKRKPVNTNTSLTLRELECLQIIAKGLSNQETATALKISTATIRTHLEHIYQKLDVSNRVEAVTEGVRLGIIEL